MREIYRIDVHDDYMPRGAPFPVWDNHPKDPARYGELPIGPHDPGYRNDGLGTGFPPDMPRPIITFHRPLGRVPPVDIYMASRDTFTVSERAKLVLEVSILKRSNLSKPTQFFLMDHRGPGIGSWTLYAL